MSEQQALQRIGDYEVLSTLGAGGMGKVYKVRNTITDRIEALKIVLPDLAGKKEVADRFLREIKLLASLHHPNIASLYTALTIGNQLVMVMEFVEGSPVSVLLEKGPIPPVQAVDYIDQTLAALSYAHSQHIIHRDIKPGNMMVTPQGVVKLMDFGIARSSEEPGLTATGASLGSLPYMSPEQIMGSAVDGRADLYSVGVSLYEMVTGRRPFEADSQYSVMTAHLQKPPTPPVQIQPGLPATLNEIILMALAKDPGGRFQTADAFRNALKAVAGSLGVSSSAAASVSERKPAAPVPVGGSQAGTQAVLQDSPTIATLPATPVTPSVQLRQSPAQPIAAAVGTTPPPSKMPTAVGASGPPLVAAAAAANPVPAGPAASAASSAPPVTAKRGGYRGFYMTLGALLVIAILVAAGLYLPRWLRTRAGGATGSSTQPSSQPAVSATSSNPATDANAKPPVEASAAQDSSSASNAPAVPTEPPNPAANPPAVQPSEPSPAPPTPSPKPKRSKTAAISEATQSGTSGAAPASQPTPDSQLSAPAVAGGNPQTEAANAAELDEAQSDMDKLSGRARAVKDSVEILRRQMEKQGMNLRGDISAAEDRMGTNMDKAQAALDHQNAKDARRYMERAEADVETLEKFLGRR